MVGTYAVAFELSRKAWLVIPTYGNAPGIDLFASRADRTVAIQVKTTKTPSAGWLLATNKIRPQTFYVFVAAGLKKPPRFFVLKGSEVGDYCDNHPTMNAVWLGKDAQQRFENRWDVLDEGTGPVTVI